VVTDSGEGLSLCEWRLGSSTGVRKTMMQTTAARQAPDTASSLPLCSMAPRRSERKKPLSKKNRAMLTELFTLPAYQNPGYFTDSAGRLRTVRRPRPAAGRVTTASNGATFTCSKHGASAVRFRGDPEPRGKPVRIRHGPATVTASIRAARGPGVRYLLQKRSRRFPRRERLRPDARRAPPVRPLWSCRGVAYLLSTILRAMTIQLNRKESV